MYIGIIESTDYDCHGYAFDEIVGIFDQEFLAEQTTKEKYLLSIKDEYSITGYRVDEYGVNNSYKKFGATKWIDDDGKWHEQKLR